MKRLVLLLAILPTLALSEAPTDTMRPEARPVVVPAYAGIRPVARPLADQPVVVQATTTMPPLASFPVPMAAPVAVTAPVMSVPADSAILASSVSTANAPEDIVTSMQADTVTGPLAIIAPDGPSDASFRPLLRPDALAPLPPSQPTAAMRPSLRPYLRPELARGAATRGELRAEQNLFALSPFALRESLRPQVRPAAFVRRAEEQQQALVRGQICGDAAIQGEVVGRVPGPGACGIENAVRVRSVAGITLTSRAVMDCRTAQALKSWVVNGARPAVGDYGGGLRSIRVIGTYSCRNRNGAASGRLSEHAHGRAVDIAGFGLRDGREITLLTDWNREGRGQILRQMWRAACGPFGTVLGPNANAAHRDHFHFDTARYRSGSYCR